ncbi:MAG TPA: Stk1 family PASTA domain-containing Ser/Thr kinase [Virgibacillus sp.]|nr:Stk1 family PASTA domain-containing Ser/Thr kinase [Virgibacillus sp.]
MLEGHLLSERYKIKSTIGGGGMANVYLADDTILDREVAIKVLRLEYANDEEFIARFDREAKAATSLSHPNVVNIFDVGEEDHILYMVMEYVDGLTLKEYIQQYGPVEVEEALSIMKQITAAIAHAHANDLVHRDIKPQNILIDSYGQVKVTDFGIAVALSATSLTKTNSILGSVHYLSPEQARGGLATKKSDIYSLGIVLYELLTGRMPFSGETPVSIALKHLQNDPPSVKTFNPSIPQSVENIVLRATAKDPFHRYENVYEMNDALETALNPDKINEAPFVPPTEAGEETKAIPIITADHIEADDQIDEDTIVHKSEVDTKEFVSDTSKKKKKKKKKKGKRRKRWMTLLAILFVLLGASVIALFVFPGLLQPKDVVIPDVIEMPFEEAKEELESLKLNVEKELIFSDDIEEDHVVKTDPRADRTVKEESTVTVYVSEGKETVTFGNFVGEDYNQVKRMLENEGYEVIPYEKHSDEPAGQIITQVQPEPEQEVVPSETRVIFEISSGPQTVTIGSLSGLTEQEALDYLKDHDLKMNKIEENSETVEEGYVIRQHPDGDTPLEKGDTVDVYISIGKEDIPPAHHTVTFTVSYTGEQNADDDESSEQTVIIYIEDMNNNFSEVYKEETITEDIEFTISLVIEPDQVGEYKVVRDDEVIIHKTIPYKEGG